MVAGPSVLQPSPSCQICYCHELQPVWLCLSLQRSHHTCVGCATCRAWQLHGWLWGSRTHLGSTVGGSSCVALVQGVPRSFLQLLQFSVCICLCVRQMFWGQQCRSSQRMRQGMRLGSPPGPPSNSQHGQFQAIQTLK